MDLQFMRRCSKSKRKKRKFSTEFKEEAVMLYTGQGITIAETASNLGINATQLSRGKKLKIQIMLMVLRIWQQYKQS
jgi:transposase-like protein